ncbi:MAG: hypothetical protein AB7R40_26375 [Nitrospiraceae bacterium]
MKSINPRPATQQETAVIQQAFNFAATREVPSAVLDSLDALSVIEECECGCRSVAFSGHPIKEEILADAVGRVRSGDTVGIIVWGNDERVSSLEIVDHQGSGELPESETVVSWEEAGRNAF